MCNRTSSPIPVKHAFQPHASSLEERLPKPGPSRRLSAPLPSGDPEKQRQDKMREEGLQLVIKIRVRIWAWEEVGQGEAAVDYEFL